MRGERNKGKEERETKGRKGRGGMKRRKGERKGKRGKGKGGGKRQCCVKPVMLVEFVQIAGIFKVSPPDPESGSAPAPHAGALRR